MSNGVVIVGGGHAACQLAGSLRSEGFDGSVRLVSAEDILPAQRPPLSKGFLTGKVALEQLPIRPEEFYATNEIELALGEEVVGIDRARSCVTSASGSEFAFDTLVLATGSTPRRLPVEGGDLEDVCVLRDVAHAVELKERLKAANDVVVIGGGFIGLEVAATASALGKSVLIVDIAPRLMGRAVSPEISEHFLALHRGWGATVLLETGIARLTGDGGKVSGIELADGSRHSVDLVLVGIGVGPNMGLAAEAGLACDNGIVVDQFTWASEAPVMAIGDCNCHPNQFAGGLFRLESIQNATDQAKTAAAAIAGNPAPYDAVPWFWSDQQDAKLQMVGLAIGVGATVTRGDRDGGRFSVFQFAGERLVAIDSVNRPADHMIGRRLIGAGLSPTRAQVADEGFNLKELLR